MSASHTTYAPGFLPLPARVEPLADCASARAGGHLAPGADATTVPGVLSGPKCRIKERDLHAIKAMRLSGMTWREIADATGRSLRAMEEIRARHKLAGLGNHVWTPEQTSALRELHAAGVNGASIAKTLGKTVSAVRQKATWEGISLRKRKADKPTAAPARPRARQRAERIKPEPVATQAKPRRCLCGCNKMFLSEGPGNRIRPECREVFANRHTGAV